MATVSASRPNIVLLSLSFSSICLGIFFWTNTISQSCWNSTLDGVHFTLSPRAALSPKAAETWYKLSQPFQAIYLCMTISFRTMSQQNKLPRLQNWRHFKRETHPSWELNFCSYHSTWAQSLHSINSNGGVGALESFLLGKRWGYALDRSL